jgi:IS5 family transposase
MALVISGANVHDKWLLAATLDAIVLRGPRGPRRPQHLCLDKGYDYADTEREVRRRRIRPHIRRRGELPLVGCVTGKPRRWVVERTNSWHNQFRGLLVRWERKGAHYQARTGVRPDRLPDPARRDVPLLSTRGAFLHTARRRRRGP